MSRKNRFIFMDSYKRKFFLKNEYKKKMVSFYESNYCNSFLDSYKLLLIKSQTPFISNRSRIRNRCLISGRSFNITKKLKISRFLFRKGVYSNSIPNFRKF